jgi:hypothetical protein
MLGTATTGAAALVEETDVPLHRADQRIGATLRAARDVTIVRQLLQAPYTNPQQGCNRFRRKIRFCRHTSHFRA